MVLLSKDLCNLSQLLPPPQHTIIWCSQMWREMNLQIIENSRMSKILFVDLSADFTMDDEHGKSRMKEATNNLASLISSLTIENEGMLIDEYIQLAQEWNDVDDQLTPKVKLYEAREYAQVLSNFVVEHPLEFLVVNMMNIESFMG